MRSEKSGRPCPGPQPFAPGKPEGPGDVYKRQVYTAGPLIHNKFVVEQLEGKGIFSREDIESIPDGAAVVVRAHGITLEQQRRLLEKGCQLEDATCPHVGRIHRIVEEESEKGRHILLIGAGKHPEVLGIASRCKSCTILELSLIHI